MTASGLHVIADLEGCDLRGFASTPEQVARVKETVTAIVKAAGLQELGNFYHFFGPGAVTAVVCLAESHISFHSWPEHGRVNVDVFVCNMTKDVSDQARRILEALCGQLFNPARIRQHEIVRNE